MTETQSTGPEFRNASHESPVFSMVSQHWAHAEQIRWTLLYNFLMASTILLLAWATIFVAEPTTARRISSVLLCIAGFLLSLLWIALGLRASSFVDMYAQLGRSTEAAPEGPFTAAEQHRANIRGVAKFARSKRVLVIVPSVFAAMYLVLGFISICQ